MGEINGQRHAMPEFHSLDPSLFLPPSAAVTGGNRHRIYLPSFDRSEVDAFYDAVETAHRVIFVNKPTRDGQLLYSHPWVLQSKTQLYPLDSTPTTLSRQRREERPVSLRRESTNLLDADDRYEYTVRFSILQPRQPLETEVEELPQGSLSIGLHPMSGSGITIQKVFSWHDVHNFDYYTARRESMRYEADPYAQASRSYPHLRLGLQDRFELWLLLPPSLYLHNYHQHHHDYRAMMDRAGRIFPRQANEQENMKLFLTHMLRPGSSSEWSTGGADMLRLIYEQMLLDHARELKALPIHRAGAYRD